MVEYLLVEHDRGAPAPENDVPMDRWSPAEVSAHLQYMNDFATRLEATCAVMSAPPRKARTGR